jgi:type I restriction enzyme S subunit
MSRLQQLIQELCPDGVEYKKLGDICIFERGTSITKKDIIEGNIPVIAGGQEPAYYCNQANRIGETIVISSSGAYAGYVSYWNQPIFVSDAFTVKPQNGLLTKYLYYFLVSKQERIYSLQKAGGVPHVYSSDIALLKIPLPPLPVQQEIVRILDTFTELIKELNAELDARKKQYEYYRNKLLSFGDEVEWKTLEEVFDIRNGYTPSKRKASFWSNGTIPWFRMEDIRVNGRILSDSIQHITPQAVKGDLFPAYSIIISTSATIGEYALLTIDALANQRFTCLSRKDEYLKKLDMKFFYYYCSKLAEWCKNNTTLGNFPAVDMIRFRKYCFPIPPIEEQQRIVKILDKFDTLVNDPNIGIPAEIEAREKQFKYYLNKLLDFKEVSS